MFILTNQSKALSRREIELKLSEDELLHPGKTGQAAWLSKGLKIEEAQYVVNEYFA